MVAAAGIRSSFRVEQKVLLRRQYLTMTFQSGDRSVSQSTLGVKVSFNDNTVHDLGAVVEVFNGGDSLADTCSSPCGRLHMCCLRAFDVQHLYSPGKCPGSRGDAAGVEGITIISRCSWHLTGDFIRISVLMRTTLIM
jgi:hypothetical protein